VILKQKEVTIHYSDVAHVFCLLINLAELAHADHVLQTEARI